MRRARLPLLLAMVLAWPVAASAGGLSKGQARTARQAFSLYLPKAVWHKLGVTPKLTPGVWVSYQEARPNANPSRMRVSVIPRPPHQFRHQHILEFRITRPTGTRAWVKVLISGRLDHVGDIDRMMLAQTGVPAMEVPILGGAGRVQHSLHVTGIHHHGQMLAGANFVVRHLGRARVTVPAGTFETRHLKVYERVGHKRVYLADMWIAAKKVPLWGVVRSVNADGVRLALSGMGTGAKTDLPPFEVRRKRAPAGSPAAIPARGKATGGKATGHRASPGHPAQGKGIERTK